MRAAHIVQEDGGAASDLAGLGEPWSAGRASVADAGTVLASDTAQRPNSRRAEATDGVFNSAQQCGNTRDVAKARSVLLGQKMPETGLAFLSSTILGHLGREWYPTMALPRSRHSSISNSLHEGGLCGLVQLAQGNRYTAEQ